VVSTLDGTITTPLPLPTACRTRTFALNGDATSVVALSEPIKGGEASLSGEQIPSDLQGLQRDTFALKHDGRVSRLLTYDLTTRKPISDRTLWYSTHRARLALVADTVYVINYNNTLAKIHADGSIALFAGQNLYNYGHAVSDNHQRALLGGLRSGTLIDLKTLTMSTFKLPSLGGWPEYLEGFAISNSGTAYGVTSSFRLVRLTPEGKVDRIVPVF